MTSNFSMLPVRVHESGSDPVRDLETAGRAAGLVVVGYRGHSANSLRLSELVLVVHRPHVPEPPRQLARRSTREPAHATR